MRDGKTRLPVGRGGFAIMGTPAGTKQIFRDRTGMPHDEAWLQGAGAYSSSLKPNIRSPGIPAVSVCPPLRASQSLATVIRTQNGTALACGRPSLSVMPMNFSVFTKYPPSQQLHPTIQHQRRADQRQMRSRLREIADLAARHMIVFLGQQSDIVT